MTSIESNASTPRLAADVELLTRSEVQALLRISDTTLWRLGRSGVLRPFRAGARRTLYHASEVRALIEKGMAARPSAAA